MFAFGLTAAQLPSVKQLRLDPATIERSRFQIRLTKSKEAISETQHRETSCESVPCLPGAASDSRRHRLRIRKLHRHSSLRLRCWEHPRVHRLEHKFRYPAVRPRFGHAA